MVQHSPDGACSDGGSQILWEDGERVFCRGWRLDEHGGRRSVLIARPAVEQLSRSSLDRLAHEYELKDDLDGAWAVRPLELVHDAGRTMLVLEDAGGEPLDRQLAAPMEVGCFLRVAIAIASALAKLHHRGLVHKDIKPTNILVNGATGEVRLTGFGIASRLGRERQSPHPPEMIAGTLAYMAPEQTGRMNRSIDSRSDLYALGVTFYQMLIRALPFTAADPMEWVHCHLARRPVPPAERLKGIPGALSAIVMKLLSKRAEDRYQTAAGLESDLRRCQTEWSTQHRVDDFRLGEHDKPDRLLIPEKLYGRQREVETLLAAFDRVVKGGAPELVLVSGYSGIGKSSVVNELQPVLVPPRGLFASGKFDQYKRDIPYSTLAQAFQSLTRALLGKHEADLAPWRDALRGTLGPNAGLIVDLIPELKLVIGEPPPVPELPPQDAQRRFLLVFRQFIAVFARPEHPLALFLDDLQWLDAATLDLLEDLLSQSGPRNLLLIGAYRDNEVTAAHPLMRKLEAIRATGRVQDIKLGTLTIEDLRGLVSDTLRCDGEQSAPLAELVHTKTGGNPFFVIQFLHVLADESLLAFDHEQARWSFDADGIDAKQYTDNVVELVAGKLTRLPRDTQDALRHLACLGNVADVAMLSIVLQMPEEEVHAVFLTALRQQLIERLERTYRFVHDRVQEATYALIPAESRAEAHLRIGRLLVAQTPPEERDGAIFEIVNQLNRGVLLMTSSQECEQVAELNLVAGKRAISSSAYASAMTYLTAGAAVLRNDAWERRPDLAFALELHSADCHICLGALQAAEQRLALLATRASDTLQRCAVGRRRVDLFTMLGDGDRAVAVGLECLRDVGIDYPAHPTKEQAHGEYDRFWSRLGSNAIETLVELPPMHHAESLATLDVLTVMTIPTHYTDANLHALIVSTAVNLCLERGNSDAAPVSYAALGLIASTRFGHYDEGYRLGKTACSLIERCGLKHFGGGRTYFNFAVLVPWKRPLKDAIDPARRAFQMGKDLGHPTFAGLAGRTVISILLASGHPLDKLEREAEQASEFVRPFGFFLDRISAPLGLIRTLRGKTAKFGSLDNGSFTESSFEERMTGEPTFAFLECYYWIRKLQARFFAGDLASAIDAADKAERWYAISVALAQYLAEMVDFHFYAALARAARCEPMGPDPYNKHREELRRHEQHLRAWAANCPQNFESRAALVGAEIARVEGRPLDAMDLYERAIASARDNGFVHDEAIACELAARFHAARGFEDVAHLYLGNARRAYLRWGADGKVRQLDQLHPRLKQDERAHGPTGMIEVPVEQLDLATVIDVSQALSGEIVVEKLIDRFMRAAIEQAGAERAVLVAVRGDELRTSAEAAVHGDEVTVQVRQHPARDAIALPDSLIRYSIRARDPVVLDDAMAQNPFSADPYIVAHHVRSVLSLPLINQGKLIGILYLENNLTPRVFTPNRIAVLKMLASQAAISLENTRLYRDLEDREGKIRRLVDANIIGIFVADLEGRIVEANDEFLRILGYDREDLIWGRVRFTDLTPPEWRERDMRTLEELNSTGTVQPFEKEYFRKDGSRVPVLIGAALFRKGGNEGVAFVLDLSERKRAEEALRESERNTRLIVDSIPGLVGILNSNGEIEAVNRQILEYYGRTLEELKKHWPDLVHPLDLSRVIEVLTQSIASGEPFEVEFRARRFDGVYRWLQNRGFPLRDANDRIVRWYNLLIDIDERKRAEEALRESEQNLRSVIDGIAGLVAVAAPNGELGAVNRQVLEYFGRSAEALKNWETINIVHSEDLPRILEIFKESIAAGIPFHYEIRLRRFDGEYRWFDARFVPIRDDTGHIVRWYVLLTDIEDRTQALARVQKLQSDFAHMNRVGIMGELAASLSHEITQPIASARNNARAAMNFLDRKPPDLSEVREALDCVVGDADRAGSIIGRIRDQIRKAPPRKGHFDLNAAIIEMIALARSAITRNGVSVQTRLADQLSFVHGDRVQIQQVVLNLILNAVEAMGSVNAGARELSISTEHDHTGVLVAVRDSGTGIDPALLERVFEPFYTTKSSGTGMGLSICRSIIDAHGGRLWVEPNQPRGAAFQFTLSGAELSS
jgi:PAS domain S-box-containing protein